MCILSEHGSIRREAALRQLPDETQVNGRSWPQTDPLSRTQYPPPPQPLHHACLCSTLLFPYYLFLSCHLWVHTPLSVVLSLNSPLSPSSALSFLFPYPLSLLVFLRSMRGNFHCSFYPGTGFHCGNTRFAFHTKLGRGRHTFPQTHWYTSTHTFLFLTHTVLYSCHFILVIATIHMISNSLTARFISPSISNGTPIQINIKRTSDTAITCKAEVYICHCVRYFDLLLKDRCYNWLLISING